MTTIKTNLDHNQANLYLTQVKVLTTIKVMINIFECYKCKCEQCGYNWITKTHDVPRVCAKCHSVKWNEGSPPATQIETRQAATIEQPSQPIQAEPKDALTAFIEKAQALKGIAPSEIITVEPEEIDQWQGWSKEEQTYDDQTGDMRTYRKHIKTGKVRWLDSETALISV